MRPTNDCKLSFRQHVCKNHAPGQQTQPQMELFCPRFSLAMLDAVAGSCKIFLYSYLKNGNCVLCVCCSGRRLRRLGHGASSSSCSSLRNAAFFLFYYWFLLYFCSPCYLHCYSQQSASAVAFPVPIYICTYTHTHVHIYIYINMYTYI